MIKIEPKQVTYPVEMDNEKQWRRLAEGCSNEKQWQSGDYHYLELSRHTVEVSAKDEFSPEEFALLMALDAHRYRFYWFDPKPEKRRAASFEKRFKKSREGFHGHGQV